MQQLIKSPPGAYTDDTQMSLATTEGCIRAYQRWLSREISYLPSVVHVRYMDWLKTQDDPYQRGRQGTLVCKL